MKLDWLLFMEFANRVYRWLVMLRTTEQCFRWKSLTNQFVKMFKIIYPFNNFGKFMNRVKCTNEAPQLPDRFQLPTRSQPIYIHKWSLIHELDLNLTQHFTENKHFFYMEKLHHINLSICKLCWTFIFNFLHFSFFPSDLKFKFLFKLCSIFFWKIFEQWRKTK